MSCCGCTICFFFFFLLWAATLTVPSIRAAEMGDFKARRGGKKAAESEEFEEEDVWAMMSAREGSKALSSAAFSSSSSSSCAWRVKATPRGGGRSAPVDIPEWSKIMNKSRDDDHGHGVLEVDEDEEEEEMAPPHEYLARRLATSQIASHSMCEGVGRTLKGRDLSKLRNTILTKTGFLE